MTLKDQVDACINKSDIVSKKVKKAITKMRLPCKIKKYINHSDVVCKKLDSCIPKSTIFCTTVAACNKAAYNTLLANPTFSYKQAVFSSLVPTSFKTVALADGIYTTNTLNACLSDLLLAISTGDYSKLLVDLGSNSLSIYDSSGNLLFSCGTLISFDSPSTSQDSWTVLYNKNSNTYYPSVQLFVFLSVIVTPVYTSFPSSLSGTSVESVFLYFSK